MTLPRSSRDTRVRIGIATVLALAAVAALLAVGDSFPWALLSSEPTPRPQPAAIPTKVTVSPATVDFGYRSYCAPPEVLSRQVAVTNTGASPASVVHWSASCGCTTSDLPESFDLAPGESRTFTATMDPWGGWGHKSQSIQFIVDEVEGGTRPGPRLELEVDLGGALHPVPGIVRRPPPDAREALEGAVEGEPWERFEGLVVSEDGLPFRITGSNVPCVRLTEQGVPPQWNIEFRWDDFDAWAGIDGTGIVERDADGRWSRVILVLATDRGECPALHIAIHNNVGTHVASQRPPTPLLGVDAAAGGGGDPGADAGPREPVPGPG